MHILRCSIQVGALSPACFSAHLAALPSPEQNRHAHKCSNSKYKHPCCCPLIVLMCYVIAVLCGSTPTSFKRPSWSWFLSASAPPLTILCQSKKCSKLRDGSGARWGFLLGMGCRDRSLKQTRASKHATFRCFRSQTDPHNPSAQFLEV